MSFSPILWGGNGIAKCLEKIPTSALTGAGATTSGTNASMIATTGSNGQLWYNTTYNSYFFWNVSRWWPFGTPDPRYGFMLYDEFIAQDIAKGVLGWLAVGSANPAPVTTGNQYGVYQINMTTVGSWASIFLYNSATQLGVMDYYIECSIQLPVLANATTDYSITVGLNDNPNASANTGSCTNGVYFNYNRSVNGGNWMLHTSNGGSVSTADSLTQPTTNWTRLGILCSASSSAKFYINGTLVGTLTTNLPTSASYTNAFAFKMDKIAGTTQTNANIDWLSLYGFFNGARV